MMAGYHVPSQYLAVCTVRRHIHHCKRSLLVRANVVSDTARSSAFGTNVMFRNIRWLISTWLFLQKDTPNFPIGNGLNLGTSLTILIASIALLFWILADDRWRENKWMHSLEG